MMPSSPYRFRPPTSEDLDAAAAVLAEDDLADAGEVVLDLGFLRAQWGRPGFDLARDAWVGVDARGEVVAYGQVTRDEPDVAGSWGVVHPAHRGRGLGGALLARLVERAPGLLPADCPAPKFRNAINASDQAAADLLLARGLHCVRHFWHMRVDLPTSAAAAAPPSGADVTDLRSPEDLTAVHAVLDTAFADHWGHETQSYADWREDYASGDDYDPTLWRLAWIDGRLAGALTASIREGRGWVDLLGVRRESRGAGVAALLLSSAFESFAARGVATAYLAVDAENPTGATALYERAGMRVVKRWDLWERTLSGGPG